MASVGNMTWLSCGAVTMIGALEPFIMISGGKFGTPRLLLTSRARRFSPLRTLPRYGSAVWLCSWLYFRHGFWDQSLRLIITDRAWSIHAVALAKWRVFEENEENLKLSLALKPRSRSI
ncbi:hypothetical protein BDZ45DRAFT_755312 [Acephala macrosclerotiorum]|nr:hypothetical protein BDZ45DRAFT_755312 [Acephala macrosclerotiorum]